MKKILLIGIISIFSIGGCFAYKSNNKVIYEQNVTNTFIANTITDNSLNMNNQNTIVKNEIITEKVADSDTNIQQEIVSKVQENEEKDIVVEDTFDYVYVPENIKEDNIIEDNIVIENYEIAEDLIYEIAEEQEESNLEDTTEIEYTENKEEYVYNSSMTQKLINTINDNPSDIMLECGYSVEIDSSILDMTNQFTFTEKRVQARIKNLFGTIKVYARDYYLNGTFIATECYIF